MSTATNIALSAMQVAEKTVEMAAKNIANANTPGYARLTEHNYQRPGVSGVETRQVSLRDLYLESVINSTEKSSTESNTIQAGLEELDALFSRTNITESYDRLLGATQDALIDPQDPVRLNAFDQAGRDFTSALRQFQTEISRLIKTTQGRLDLSNIELQNIEAELSNLASRPFSEDIQTQISALTNRAQILSGSIAGLNKLLNSIIPPIMGSFQQARSALSSSVNTAFGQQVINDRFVWSYDSSLKSNFEALSQVDSGKFSADIGTVRTNIGSQVQAETSMASFLNNQLQSFKNRAQTEYGVDTVSEVLKMQQYQRMYEAAAAVIKTQDEMIGSLIDVLA